MRARLIFEPEMRDALMEDIRKKYTMMPPRVPNRAMKRWEAGLHPRNRAEEICFSVFKQVMDQVEEEASKRVKKIITPEEDAKLRERGE